MSYKIILVENDEDEIFFMKEAFDSSDLFEVLSAAKDGEELFEYLNKNSDRLPDIILSDLNMPGKNGYDILQEIKAYPDYSHIPVVITSTSTVRSNIDRCLGLGAADYIVKPEMFIFYKNFVNELHERIQLRKLVK